MTRPTLYARKMRCPAGSALRGRFQATFTPLVVSTREGRALPCDTFGAETWRSEAVRRRTDRVMSGIEETASAGPITRAKPSGNGAYRRNRHSGAPADFGNSRHAKAGKTAAIGAEAKRPDGSAGLTAAGLAFRRRAASLGENQNFGGARSIEIKRTQAIRTAHPRRLRRQRL